VRSAREAKFANTNLSGIDLSGVDFTDAMVSGGTRIWDDPQHQVIAGAETSLAGTDFTGANLTNTLFDEIDTSKVKSFAGTSFDPVKSADFSSWSANYAASHGQPDPKAWVQAYVSSHGLVQNGNVYSDPGTVLQPAGGSQPSTAQAAAALPALATGVAGDAGMDLALKTLTEVGNQLRAAAGAAKSDKDGDGSWVDLFQPQYPQSAEAAGNRAAVIA
jgi:hypothetical protein